MSLSIIARFRSAILRLRPVTGGAAPENGTVGYGGRPPLSVNMPRAIHCVGMALPEGEPRPPFVRFVRESDELFGVWVATPKS